MQEDQILGRLSAELHDIKQRVAELEQSEAKIREWLTASRRINALHELLLRSGSIEEKLTLVTDALIDIFRADLARFWLLRTEECRALDCPHSANLDNSQNCTDRNNCLHLVASSGTYKDLTYCYDIRIPLQHNVIGKLASNQEQKLCSFDIAGDPRIHNQSLFKESGLISFTGCRLSSRDTIPIGVVGLFTSYTLSQDDLMLFERLADTASQVIQSALTDEARCKSENLYRSLVQTSPDPIIIYDLKGDLLAANLQAALAYGVDSAEELLAEIKTVFDLLDDESKEFALKNIKKTLKIGSSRKTEYNVKSKKGVITRVEINSTMVQDADNLPTAFISVVRDVSERKKRQQAFRDNEERLRLAWDTVPDALTISRLDNATYIDVNKGYTVLTGYEAAEVIGKSALELPFWYDLRDREPFIAKLMRDGTISNYETKLRRKDGSPRSVLISAALLNMQDEQYLLAVTKDIEELTRTRQALNETEARYKKLVETTDTGFVEIDVHGNVIRANKPYARMVGFADPSNLIGRNMYDWTLNDNREENRKFIESSLHYGRASEFETVYTKPDGNQSIILINAFSEITPEGRHVVALCRDVTDREKMARALKASERKYRELVENAKNVILRWSCAGKITFINKYGLTLFGYSEGDLIGKPIIGTIMPEVETGGRFVGPLIDQICLNPEAFEPNVIESIRKDGTRIWVEWTNRAVETGDSHEFEIFSIGTDVTDRKKLENAIRSIVTGVSSQIGSKFFDSIVTNFASTLGADCTFIGERVEKNGLLYIKTLSLCLDGQVTENTEYPLMGSPCEVVLDKGLCSFINGVQESFPNARELMMLKAEGYVGVELTDSSGVPIGIMAAIYRSPIQNVEMAESILQIFAARTAAEINRKRIEEDRLRLVTAIEHAGESIIITDDSGKMLYVNPSFTVTTGYSSEESLGNTPMLLKSGKHNKQFYKDLWSTIRRGRIWRGRFTNRRKDGTLYEETATISPIRDESGNILNYVMVGRDVTSEANLQKQLFHSQKMEAIGTLAGGIAHDINNLLQAVLGYADLLLLKKSADDPDRRQLEIIQRSALDGADLVSRILTFSRKREPKARPMDLNEEIRRAEGLLRRTLPKMIDIELRLAPDLRIMDGDPAQIEQILLNLSVNAQHAMSEGGKLLIETDNVSLSDEYLRAHLGAKKGKYVRLTVSDTGIGIESHILDRIFEPFFTTKANGLGTGLGLAMVHGIVGQHKGYIRCYSELGKGTSFKIYFPISATELLDVAMTREMPAFGSETILLVDDDERIRELGRQIIEMGGYNVMTASNGQEALELYARYGKSISLVVLDLIMPGMSGKRCLKELLATDPKVKVLVASGYSSNGLSSRDRDFGERGFISKPYDTKDILAAIRTILDRGYL